MIGERQVEIEVNGADYVLIHAFCDGEIEIIHWLMNGLEVKLPESIEWDLIDRAYDEHRDRHAPDPDDYDDRETPIERVERLNISPR